jgi:hypothetical protein
MSIDIGTVVLDSEGLSAWLRSDRRVMALLREFHEMGADLVACANTIVEVTHKKADMPRLNWLLSQIRIESVTKESAKGAAALLVAAGLRGHAHAIDATVAETALRQARPVAMLTSDPEDIRKLCGPEVHPIKV